MPWIGEAWSNGLKLSVRLSSGEDSMTRAGWFELVLLLLLLLLPALEPLALGLLELLEEQAARPAARSVTAPAASTLLPGILLVVNFDLSSRVLRVRGGVFLYLDIRVTWLDGAARDMRGGYVQSPARR